MKTIRFSLQLLSIASLLLLGCLGTQAQIIDDIKNNAKQTATNKTEDQTNTSTTNGFNKMDSAANKGLNKLKGMFKKKPNTPATTNANATNANATNAANPAAAASGGPVSITAYSNYDFVPGEQIVFEDHFTDDQDGEFPAHWKLTTGQAIINKLNSDPAFFITDGNYARVAPRMKTEKGYLPANFTVEFDFFAADGAAFPLLLFTATDDGNRFIQFGPDVSSSYFPNDLSAPYPGDKDNFSGKWHHAAFIKRGNQIKCYEDQYRVLVMPDCGSCDLSFVEVGGIGDKDHPMIFDNFRLAEGGNMNMIGQKFTDNKIVTHGINFDVDKSTIRPESMGTLNMIVNILTSNPDLKFEIDGHTDNSGSAPHNLTLSQQRADAVRAQLITMGIDGSRLTTKGFGDTQPISDNNTIEGKANNRRVVFTKI
jgi:flagellar motor protein MotB